MRKSHSRTLKNVTSAAKQSYRLIDQAAGGFGRWMITDHSGFGKSLLNMPSMGFWDSCRYILNGFLYAVAGSILTGILVFLLITFGMPLLISLLVM